ncbi:pseudaminic acid cytidylyltransferase [Spiribacter sp. 218]|uniref:pseudaminic acid cytidylyltransferase n=1 Tax=Spiribacter pallidus TaxID=1987936 RepID=UPI00349F51E5
MNLCVIPARGGSKRIPRKNIREFCGKPIIAWSIEAALASDCFDLVIVSTDDDEIAAVARQWGADVPFMRPMKLADDYAGTLSVIGHATEWVLCEYPALEAVCCLYPTAPLVEAVDIRRGRDVLEQGDWEYCFTATEFSAPIFRGFTESGNGGIEMVFPEHFETRSQDLPVVLHDAGQFYWGRPQAWRKERPLFGSNSCPLRLPNWRVSDIDNENDWRRTELIAEVLWR